MKKQSFVLSFLVCVTALIPTIVSSQGRIPMLGEEVPSFQANSTTGRIEFPQDFGNHWKILFSHPEDFTPVCTSEILQLAQMQDEFKNLDVKLAIISTDELSSHQEWKLLMEDILKDGGTPETINFPLIEDAHGRISHKYGMLHAWENTTRDVRGVFIIDPENRIQSISFYPMTVGRNMEEIKRVVVALQTSEKDQVLIPVNWNQGEDVLMKHLPYTEQELAANPDLENQYYKVGVNMWYKRVAAE